jgi:hypothetical protein
MPRGTDPGREKEYGKLVDEFHDQHRYAGREEEVASRIINKQRAEHGETKAAVQEDKEGESPDRNLPIKNYDRLDVDSVVGQLDDLSHEQLRLVKTYEQAHNNRVSLKDELDRRLK